MKLLYPAHGHGFHVDVVLKVPVPSLWKTLLIGTGQAGISRGVPASSTTGCGMDGPETSKRFAGEGTAAWR